LRVIVPPEGIEVAGVKPNVAVAEVFETNLSVKSIENETDWTSAE
jgi:hypothetical protein